MAICPALYAARLPKTDKLFFDNGLGVKGSPARGLPKPLTFRP